MKPHHAQYLLCDGPVLVHLILILLNLHQNHPRPVAMYTQATFIELPASAAIESTTAHGWEQLPPVRAFRQQGYE